MQHSRTTVHKKTQKSVKNTQVLDGSYSRDEEILKADEKTIYLVTRKSWAEAVVCSFIADSLLFSLAPEIIKLWKTLA